MTTRVRSTPSSVKTRCWSLPVKLQAFVWVLMGTPVCRWARATARNTRSMFGVTSCASVQHLRIPAFTPVVPMPSSMSSTNMSTMTSSAAPALGRREAKNVGSSSKVYNPVATTMLMPTEADGREIDDRVDAAAFELLERGDRLGDPSLLGTAPAPLRPVRIDLRGEDEDVLVHERGAQTRGVNRAPDCLDLR